MEPVTLPAEARTRPRPRPRLGRALVLVTVAVLAGMAVWFLLGRPDGNAAAPALTISSAIVSEGDDVASGYLAIDNRGGGDELIAAAVSPDLATSATLHRSQDQGGRVVMAATTVEVPGGRTTHLQPGGDHLMLEGLHRPLQPGDEVTLNLTFRRAGEVVVRASVRSYADIARSLEEATP